MFDFISNLFSKKEEIEVTERRSCAEFLRLLEEANQEFEEDVIFNSVKETRKDTVADVEDVEVKSEKVYQAGVDYPSLVIQDDGSHIFTWGEDIIILSKDEATDGAVTEIMRSSFSMFQANSKIFKEKSTVEEDATKADARVEELKEANTSIDSQSKSDVEDVEAKPAKVYQAGVDYPSLVIQEDGTHVFTWGDEFIILHLDEATKEAVSEIMQSSFAMFQVNSKLFREKLLSEEVDEKVAEVEQPTRVEELKEAITSIDANQSKSAEQTAMAEAIGKAMGKDTLKAAAAEDRIHDAEERKEFVFSRVKRRNR